jgi:tRNA threonylcarbamoyladenosine dehydratase
VTILVHESVDYSSLSCTGELIFDIFAIMLRGNELISFSCGVLAASMCVYCLKSLESASKPVNLSSLDNKRSQSLPAELKEELLSRTKSYFGEEKFQNIESAFVIVVGLGGVGSHAANMLVRSGVGRIRLIDFDQVSLSSLNRHAIASLEDVGRSKAETMKRKLLRICPWCNIESITEIFKLDSAERMLEGKPDYVLDCIDDIHTKGALIAYCVKNGLQVLTSMGAGAKADPTKLRIAPLSDCVNDPLAAKIKWKMRKLGVSSESVMTVFSIEKPSVDLLPLDDNQVASPQDYGSVDYFRIRVMPVLGTSPSIFGQTMASYVLCHLAGSFHHLAGFHVSYM